FSPRISAMTSSTETPRALASASAERLSRSSGISTISYLLQGSRDTAVLADTPEVNGHEDDDYEREGKHMEDIEPEQGRLAHLQTGKEKESDLLSDQRCGPSHVGSDGDRPVGELVPGEQITGEGEHQGEQ